MLKIDFPNEIPDLKINGKNRKDIYLAAKETRQNVIKHAEAAEIYFSKDINNLVPSGSSARDPDGTVRVCCLKGFLKIGNHKL
ncbi:MAG: hypothetical protein KKG25_13820 [Bacteroidetes bacterium]|nr:hypothetical protein [Bacteroidota bacterium]MBU1485923.1 hypothetical protein [Bacteroidota bacterium]MBU2269344.1 hypothetical protein [Bacteroidota bacterium]MBU2375925.1 hypothetical protein [Bacteroidota bacterium]